MISDLLIKVLESNVLDYDAAKMLSRVNWRSWKAEYPPELQRDIELFFQFVEGLIHQVDDGFVGEGHDSELYDDLKKLMKKILRYEKDKRASNWPEDDEASPSESST